MEYSVDEASQVQARKASNLAFAFFCMEKDRARDMEVFYAYCRILDDIADEESRSVEEKIRALNAWKDEIETIYSARGGKLSKMGAEIRDLVMRRNIPKGYMLDIIDGVMRDTNPAPIETVEEIHHYCYGVACAVGLVSIYIFGFKNEKTKEFAKALGYAFQFTNILRDVVYDYKTMGRVYVPKCELEAFGVSPEDFGAEKLSENVIALFTLLHFRAKHYFNRARALICLEDAKALTPAFIMWEIYEKILDTIAAKNFEISERAIKFSKAKKICLAFKALRKAKKYSKAPAENFGSAAVLGGGIAGIAAAVNLSRKGYEVDLFEAKAHIGGRMSAMDWKQANVRIDNASHALMASCTNFFAFLKTLGVEKKHFSAPAENMSFLSKSGENFEFKFPTEGFNGIFGTFLNLPKIDGFGIFGTLFFLAKIKLGFAKAYEDETVAQYLDRMNISEVETKMLWEPFCVSVQNTDISEASAKMFRISIRETLLKGAKQSALILNKTPLSDIVWPRAKYFIEACRGRVHLSASVSDLEFSGKKISGFRINGELKNGYDFYALALPHKMLASLLPPCPLLDNIAQLKNSPILNIYFSTAKKLFKGDFAGLSDSPIHWIFDRNCEAQIEGLNLYSLTISSFNGEFSPSGIKDLVKLELEKFFGEFDIVHFLPTLFKDATIISTPKNEALRPKPCGHFENAAILGDWTDCALPATIENAVKCSSFIP